jgi:hypothetical protein
MMKTRIGLLLVFFQFLFWGGSILLFGLDCAAQDESTDSFGAQTSREQWDNAQSRGKTGSSVSMNPLDDNRPDISDVQNAQPRSSKRPGTIVNTQPQTPPYSQDRSPSSPDNGWIQNDRNNQYGNYSTGRSAGGSCRSGQGIRPPRIQVGRVAPVRTVLSGKYRIEGSMLGACVKEAGYFENGRLRGRIDFPYTDAFERREFTFEATAGNGGALRIYNSLGDEDVVDLDNLIANSK